MSTKQNGPGKRVWGHALLTVALAAVAAKVLWGILIPTVFTGLVDAGFLTAMISWSVAMKAAAVVTVAAMLLGGRAAAWRTR